MSEFREFREFWVYRNEEYAPTYACDFNQRGFVPSRNRESIHVIEYAALEQAKKDVEGVKEQLLAQCKITHELLDEKAILNYQLIKINQEVEKLVEALKEISEGREPRPALLSKEALKLFKEKTGVE